VGKTGQVEINGLVLKSVELPVIALLQLVPPPSLFPMLIEVDEPQEIENSVARTIEKQLRSLSFAMKHHGSRKFYSDDDLILLANRVNRPGQSGMRVREVKRISSNLLWQLSR
jgi:hypothetical protein